MIRNGNVDLQAREEEIRFIKMALNEEKRKQELLWKQLPNKRSLEEELVTLQIQLQQCQDRMLELEKQLEDPYDESRVRYLEGKDLPPAKLQDKIEDVRTTYLIKNRKLHGSHIIKRLHENQNLMILTITIVHYRITYI